MALNKKWYVIIGLFISVGIGFAFYFSPETTSSATIESNNKVTDTYVLRLEAQNTSDLLIVSPTVEMLLPIKPSSKNQQVSLQITESELNTHGAFSTLTMPNIAPFGYSAVDILFEVTSEISSVTEHIVEAKYLSASQFVESTQADITTLSNELTSNDATQAEQVESIFNWVVTNISHGGFTQQNQGALYALKQRKGDCTEFSYLTAALLRAANIPARIAVGFNVEATKRLKAKDLHNWVEVYFDGRWQLLDPQNNNYLAAYSDYLQLGIINEENPSLGVLNKLPENISVSF